MEKFETRCDYDIFIKKEKERKISCADMDEYGSVKNKWPRIVAMARFKDRVIN